MEARGLDPTPVGPVSQPQPHAALCFTSTGWACRSAHHVVTPPSDVSRLLSIALKMFTENRIKDHFIVSSSTNCLKQSIKHSRIPGIDIPHIQVSDVCYQGMMLRKKNQNCPSREHQLHLGSSFLIEFWTPIQKQGSPIHYNKEYLIISLSSFQKLHRCQPSHSVCHLILNPYWIIYEKVPQGNIIIPTLTLLKSTVV